MRIHFLFILVLIFTSCKDEIVPEPYRPRNEFDSYRHSLDQLDLLNSALGKDWLSASESALEKPNPITPPFKEAFYLDPNKAEAIGYRFSVKRGQKIKVNITVLSSDSLNLFIDLYRINNDSLNIWQHVASADSLESTLAFEPRRDADYILRLQPELLRGGRFGISILKVPTFTFPVSGKNSGAIGSYFGDPRDGGRREHHGVDIFAKRHTPIVAPTRAYVRWVGERGLGGNVIWLRDSKGQNLYFAHLQTQLVKPHTYINPGDTIGTVGNTGNAKTTPPHLHFGIYKNGPKDPINFIRETNINLPEIKTDLTLLGNWIRTTQETFLNVFNTSQIVIDTLDTHSLLKVVGLSGSILRVADPDGTIGYVNNSITELVNEPLSNQSIRESLSLLNKPGSGGITTITVGEGETLYVLARHDNYWFVQTSSGNSGWINSL